MKNNHGQALFLVIILLPIIIMALGFMIEVSLIGYYEARLNSVTKTVIENVYDSPDEEEIRALYEKNDIKIKEIKVNTDKGLQIKVSHEIDSFLGGLINKDKYTISTHLIGTKAGDKIVYKKG